MPFLVSYLRDDDKWPFAVYHPPVTCQPKIVGVLQLRQGISVCSCKGFGDQVFFNPPQQIHWQLGRASAVLHLCCAYLPHNSLKECLPEDGSLILTQGLLKQILHSVQWHKRGDALIG